MTSEVAGVPMQNDAVVRSAMASGRPTVSVVIPSYNRCAATLVAVQSALEQDYPPAEVIVIDDGSTDDSVERLRQLTDPRVMVLATANGGAGAARNHGIDLASGDYIAFLDSDDRFLPHHLTDLMALVTASPLAVGYSAVIADRGQGRRFVKPWRGIRPGENMATYLMCERGFVQTSGLLVPRTIAAKVRYRPDVSFGDDTDFAIRLALAGCTFRMSAVPSVIWSDDPRPDRLSADGFRAAEMPWLIDLRRAIPSKAYHAYLGWHVAKQVRASDRFGAFRLFGGALLHRAYGPRTAAVVFLQLLLSGRRYRALADGLISLRDRFVGSAVQP